MSTVGWCGRFWPKIERLQYGQRPNRRVATIQGPRVPFPFNCFSFGGLHELMGVAKSVSKPAEIFGEPSKPQQTRNAAVVKWQTQGT